MLDFDRKFLFVTGKGGVGKSTVSVALAQALAARGQRVLLALTGDAIARRLLPRVSMGSDAITRVEARLWATVIEPESALREYGTLVLKSKMAYKALFENRYSRSFLAAIPGLHQWAVLGKAWFHAEERSVDGQKRFDAVVFDAPATGHGLEMLRVPKLIVEVAPRGILREDADKAVLLLGDARRAGIVVVTLAEELVVSESLELLQELEELDLPIAQVVVNAKRRKLLAVGDERAVLESRSRVAPSIRPFLDVVLDRAKREASEANQLERLRTCARHPVFVLPWSADAASGTSCRALVEALAGS